MDPKIMQDVGAKLQQARLRLVDLESEVDSQRREVDRLTGAYQVLAELEKMEAAEVSADDDVGVDDGG